MVNIAAPNLFTAAPDAAPSPLTLADIIVRLLAKPDLDPRVVREQISALRTLGRAFGDALDAIPADLRHLRDRMAGMLASNAGIQRPRWNNVRSLVLAALRQSGVRATRGRAARPLGPAWHALRALLPPRDEKKWIGLSRFMSDCDAEGVSPCAVRAARFDAFDRSLIDHSLSGRPKAVGRTTRLLWNEAARTIKGWPDLIVPVPDNAHCYALDWSAFPDGFRTDAEAFLTRAENPDPFSDAYAKPIMPGTVALRRNQILLIATALVGSGQPASAIPDLATLTLVPNAWAALRFFRDRNGGKLTGFMHQHALLLKTIARQWAKASTDEIRELGELCRRLAIKKTGMTEKNRALLRQFDDPENLAALLHLSTRVRREVREKNAGGRDDATRVMFALAVDLLLIAPVRVDNLTGLEVKRHFVSVRRGAGQIHLVIPGRETKTKTPYEVELPRPITAALANYRAVHLPRLTSGPSLWLFPDARGERRRTGTFATQVCGFVKKETGLVMNIHLFRHLAAKLHLEVYPDDIETVRQFLGHKSVATTLAHYAEIKTAAAFRRHDSVIASLREQTRPRVNKRVPPGKNPRGRGRS